MFRPTTGIAISFEKVLYKQKMEELLRKKEIVLKTKSENPKLLREITDLSSKVQKIEEVMGIGKSEREEIEEEIYGKIKKEFTHSV